MTGWVFIVLGAPMCALGFAQLAGYLKERSRRMGWSDTAAGLGFVFIGLGIQHRVSWDDPTPVWQWAGTGLLGAALILRLLDRRARDKAEDQRADDDAPAP